MCAYQGCSEKENRKGMCERHYYVTYRKNVKNFDVNDFWNFVKKELRLENR